MTTVSSQSCCMFVFTAPYLFVIIRNDQNCGCGSMVTMTCTLQPQVHSNSISFCNNTSYSLTSTTGLYSSFFTHTRGRNRDNRRMRTSSCYKSCRVQNSLFCFSRAAKLEIETWREVSCHGVGLENSTGSCFGVIWHLDEQY